MESSTVRLLCMPALCVTIWKYFDRCIFLCPATLWLGWTPWLSKNWTVSQARHEALLLISLQGTERPQRLIQNASYTKTETTVVRTAVKISECRVSQCSGTHIWVQGLRAIALTRHTHTWQPLSPLPAVCSVGQHWQSKDTSFILQSLKQLSSHWEETNASEHRFLCICHLDLTLHMSKTLPTYLTHCSDTEEGWVALG